MYGNRFDDVTSASGAADAGDDAFA
jgi:hypothetical protein